MLFSSEPTSKQKTPVLHLAESLTQSQSGGLSGSDHPPTLGRKLLTCLEQALCTRILFSVT